jgi:hypothetical protein
MSETLLSLVESNLLPGVDSLGMSVLTHEESGSFDNALVVLQAGDIRIRIVRERSQVFVDFGSSGEPAVWFDSAVVMEYFGLSETAGWHDRDGIGVLRGLAEFLRVFQGELATRLSPANFPVTKQGLTSVREEQATRRFC